MLTLRKSVQNHRIIRQLPCVMEFSDENKLPLGEDEKKKLKGSDNKQKDRAALERLKNLLVSMSTDDNLSTVKKIMEVPKARRKQRTPKASSQLKEQETKDVVEAVKEVAKLSSDAIQTESELLSKLLQHTENSKNENNRSSNIGELIAGMKIDRSERRDDGPQTRGEFVRKVMAANDTDQKRRRKDTVQMKGRQLQIRPSTGSVNLFGGDPLKIFAQHGKSKESSDILKTWAALEERELKLAITHPPVNYFQKIALWTEQGKFWKFPIDNEQGMIEEAEVHFTDHVFVEQHLESWCPTKGPIRHFMELVCVGLSKNPYITANDKLEHIMWYKNYFEQKKDILAKIIIESKENEKKTII